MQIQLTPETPEDDLTIRAFDAFALEQGKTQAEAIMPWIKDLASSACNRGRITEAAVQEAEARGRNAMALREAQAALMVQRSEAPAELGG
jgi:hypothetical protein